MAKRDNNKLIAEGMFVDQGMTCKAISEMIGVSEKTLSKWRNDGRWDDKREANLAAPHKIKELLLQDLIRVSRGEKSTINADELSKIWKVFDAISDIINPHIAISILKAFDNWMSVQEPAVAVSFLPWHKKFIQYIIEQHG